jgi:hypothetical protein
MRLFAAHQFPGAMPYHSYGTLSGIRPTPPQFVCSPLNSEMVSNPKLLYRRVYSQETGAGNIRKGMDKFIEQGVLVGGPVNAALTPSPAMSSYIASIGRRALVSAHANYIPPVASSMYTNARKSVAVGKSAYKIGPPIAAPISTKSYFPSSTRSSLQRARSGGCTAPKKKGSIYNTQLSNGAVCAWGALPRQNY